MASDDDKAAEIRAKLSLRLPGLKESVGAGDVVAAVTKTLGIKHCSECERRKQAMNRVLSFKAKLRDKK